MDEPAAEALVHILSKHIGISPVFFTPINFNPVTLGKECIDYILLFDDLRLQLNERMQDHRMRVGESLD